MPFYLRKSISAGPFKFNLSNSGLGISVGVKGLRLGTGPRGHYVHAGRGGFYYRASLNESRSRKPRDTSSVAQTGQGTGPPVFNADGVEMIEVESGDVQLMKDEAFKDVIDEINEKRKRTKLAHYGAVLGILTTVAGVALFQAQGAFAAFLIPVTWGLGKWLDSFRTVTVLMYDLDAKAKKLYENLISAFDEISSCTQKWHIEAGGAIQTLGVWKRNSGASHLVQRKQTALGFGLPDTLTCNITPPVMGVGRQRIFFLPDAALIEDGNKIGAIGYSSLRVDWQESIFIEEETVPTDSQVIGYRWKHPNKKGGPDRRFRDNYQIPLCLYEAMHLSSESGLNELIEVSRTGVVGPFAAAIARMPVNQALVDQRRIALQ